MNSASLASARTRRGFTIIELLVAVGVTAILVTLMVTITLNVLNAWNRSSGSLTANGTARVVLDQLAQDLTGAVLKRDSNVWLAATIQRDPPGDGDANIPGRDWSNSDKPSGTVADRSLYIDDSGRSPVASDLRFGKTGVWLRLFTAQPDSNGGALQNVSAPRAVGYQIIRRDIGSAASPQYVYQLFRSEVRPYHDNAASQARSTFGVGYDLYTSDTNGYNDAATTNDKDAANVRHPLAAQLIGNDVIDFGLRLFERNAAGNLVEVFPVNRRDSVSPPTSVAGSSLAYAATSSTTAVQSGSGPVGATTRGFPVAAELVVRVLTPEGARLIQALEEGTLTGQNWWDIAEAHSKVYTRFVEIKSRPL